ncbi:hypothetical protein U0070_010910, partial [Myodes glareolus]
MLRNGNVHSVALYVGRSMDCDIGSIADQGQQQPGLEACLKRELKLIESTLHCSHKHLCIASTCLDKLSWQSEFPALWEVQVPPPSLQVQE